MLLSAFVRFPIFVMFGWQSPIDFLWAFVVYQSSWQEGFMIKPVHNVWAEQPGSSAGARWKDILVPNK